MPVFELVSELEPVLEFEVALSFEPKLEPVPVLELDLRTETFAISYTRFVKFVA